MVVSTGSCRIVRALVLEYGSHGVRVNAVAPSLTCTEATSELETIEAVQTAFLASDDARFVNGAVLTVALGPPTDGRTSWRRSPKAEKMRPDRRLPDHLDDVGRHPIKSLAACPWIPLALPTKANSTPSLRNSGKHNPFCVAQIEAVYAPSVSHASLGSDDP